jgi:membrane-associated phospholipid phosphatase
MLLWAGFIFIALGAACIGIDRRATHVFYDRIGAGLHGFLRRTTHLAKAAHWLAAACLVWAISWERLSWHGEDATFRLAWNAAGAFILALALGSAILHSIKLLLGRRRPRDELEMNLYGFIPFACDLRMNSFPSGHSLTIFIVATIATALWPPGAAVWFAVALWLSLTRAMLCAHFLSDVFVGAGIGLICARETLLLVYPMLSRSWF